MGPQRPKGNGENTDNPHKIKSFGAGASKVSATQLRAVLNPYAGQIYPPVYPDAVSAGVKASTTKRTITSGGMGASCTPSRIDNFPPWKWRDRNFKVARS